MEVKAMLAQQETLDQIGARLLALAATDAPPHPLSAVSDDLDRNLGTVIQKAQSLKGNVQQLKGRIDRVTALLNRPKEVADALRSLSGDLGTLSTLLRVVQVVRVIRPAADVLRRQVDLLKQPVDSAERTASALERNVAPLRDRLRQLSQAMDDFLRRLDQVITHTTTARNRIAGVKRCMTSLPPGPARDQGMRLLDDFARTVNPPVEALIQALEVADGAVGAVNRELSTLEDQLNQLKSLILDSIASVRNVFNPILGPLRSLQSALDYRIDIKIFSFSVRDILEGLSLPWPFSYLEEAFWEAANAILQPILRTLHLDITLPSIPGLDLLSRIRFDLPAVPQLEEARAKVQGLADNAGRLLDRFNVECPPKSQTLFSESLLAELGAAEMTLVQ
jgi:prefoldin subunit 5